MLISLMGMLTGFERPVDTGILLEKRITLQGIDVGRVETLQALLKTNIAPQVNHIIPFETDLSTQAD
ncbi:hypothetical protein [Gluconobacter sp.]|uniref:hypothetical protein n=1 Tax=Gluconobacter sp. TaxID=1876758 RepID=UPI0039E7A2CD